MKKYLFFLLSLVVASFAFISCSSDDDDNGDYDKSMIVGTWEMDSHKKTSCKALVMAHAYSNVVMDKIEECIKNGLSGNENDNW